MQSTASKSNLTSYPVLLKRVRETLIRGVKLQIAFLIILSISRDAFANSADKQLTALQDAGKLKICVYDSNGISMVSMNSHSANPLMGNAGTNFSFSNVSLYSKAN